METESHGVGARGWGGGGGSSCLKGTESEFHKTESVMGVDGGGGHVIMRVCLSRTAHFVVCAF